MDISLEEINSFVLPSLDPQARALLAALCERVQALEAEVKALSDANEGRALEIALANRRITALEGPAEPQPKQKDRGEILRALLAAHDGKMLEKIARQKMGMPKNQFSELLRTLEDYIETRPYSQDKRQNLLILK